MKKKTRSKIKYTDDKGEMDGKWRIVRRGELPDLDALLDKLPEKTKVTLELDNSAWNSSSGRPGSETPAISA